MKHVHLRLEMNPMHISMNEFCFVQLPIGRGHDDNWERSVSFFLGRVHHPTHPHIFLSNLVSGSSVRRNNLWCFHSVVPLYQFVNLLTFYTTLSITLDFRCLYLYLFFYHPAGTFLCFMRFQHCFEWLPIGRAMAGSFAAVGANEASVVPQISGCQKPSNYPWGQNLGGGFKYFLANIFQMVWNHQPEIVWAFVEWFQNQKPQCWSFLCCLRFGDPSRPLKPPLKVTLSPP